MNVQVSGISDAERKISVETVRPENKCVYSNAPRRERGRMKGVVKAANGMRPATARHGGRSHANGLSAPLIHLGRIGRNATHEHGMTDPAARDATPEILQRLLVWAEHEIVPGDQVSSVSEGETFADRRVLNVQVEEVGHSASGTHKKTRVRRNGRAALCRVGVDNHKPRSDRVGVVRVDDLNNRDTAGVRVGGEIVHDSRDIVRTPGHVELRRIAPAARARGEERSARADRVTPMHVGPGSVDQNNGATAGGTGPERRWLLAVRIGVIRDLFSRP